MRALKPTLIKTAIESWKIVKSVEIASPETLKSLSENTSLDIIMPDEDISHDLAKKYFPTHDVQYSPIFLRWDRRRSDAEEMPGVGQTISTSPTDIELMQLANQESWHSSDIWRRVGALIARDGQALLHAHNQALPTDTTPWTEGDPRNNFVQGEGIDMSLFIHAEAALIAQAAASGLALAGTTIYVTTFPCPNCAKLIVNAGLTKCYFVSGYSMLDANRLFEAAGVEVIKVDTKLPDQPSEVWAPYPQDR